MLVYLELPTKSRGLQRVYDALVRYMPPGIEVTTNYDEADLYVLHVIGRRDRIEKQVSDIKARGKKYAIIQYCLKSTMSPKVEGWVDIWKDAQVVWSYYNLNNACDRYNDKDELVTENEDWDYGACYYDGYDNFYYAPLGVDSTVFEDKHIKRDFVIATHSKSDELTEGVKECALAAQVNGQKIFHLGEQLNRNNAICLTDISDVTLAHMYSRCEFVSGLRRIEGFEQPVLEGLLCGARPIVFDRPEMRHWYEDVGAIFIKEEPREKVIESLTAILKLGARPTTEYEKKIAREKFSWDKIITNFWARIV